MLNSLDPDQALSFVGPDLGPNCFVKVICRRRESPLAGKKLKINCYVNIYVHSCLRPLSNERNPCLNHEIPVLIEHGF